MLAFFSSPVRLGRYKLFLSRGSALKVGNQAYWTSKLAQNCREPCRGDGGELPLFCGVDRFKRTVSGAKTSSSNSLDQKYPLPNRSAVGTQRSRNCWTLARTPTALLNARLGDQVASTCAIPITTANRVAKAVKPKIHQLEVGRSNLSSLIFPPGPAT